MSIAMVLKIFSDCCICFAILCAGPVEFTVPALIPALLLGVSAGIATFLEGKGWTVLRRICGLLPFACLLLTDQLGQTFIVAVPAVYTAYVILRGNLDLEYSEFRYFFIRSMMLLGVAYIVANIWIFLTSITSEEVFRPDASVILRYGLVHVLCGVVLQRQLRLGVGNRAEGGRRQMVTLLGTAGVIVVGFLAAEPMLRKNAGAILRFVFSLIVAPFAFLGEMVVRLVSSMKNTQKDQQIYEEFVEYWQGIMMGDRQNAGIPQEQPQRPEFDPSVLWMVLAVVLLLVAALLLLRSFRKGRTDSVPGEQVRRVTSVPKKKKTSPLSTRGRVRQLYREFLRTEKQLGMPLKPCHTSGDVLEKIHKNTDRSSADALRQVYLIARYDDRQTITRGQVEQAKRALRGTRSGKT